MDVETLEWELAYLKFFFNFMMLWCLVLNSIENCFDIWHSNV